MGFYLSTRCHEYLKDIKINNYQIPTYLISNRIHYYTQTNNHNPIRSLPVIFSYSFFNFLLIFFFLTIINPFLFDVTLLGHSKGPPGCKYSFLAMLEFGIDSF